MLLHGIRGVMNAARVQLAYGLRWASLNCASRRGTTMAMVRLTAWEDWLAKATKARGAYEQDARAVADVVRAIERGEVQSQDTGRMGELRRATLGEVTFECVGDTEQGDAATTLVLPKCNVALAGSPIADRALRADGDLLVGQLSISITSPNRRQPLRQREFAGSARGARSCSRSSLTLTSRLRLSWC